MFEIVGAMVALRSGKAVPESSAESLLVRFACRTLLDAPPGLIDAVTLSLPAGDAARLADLQMLCRRLAVQHRLRAEMAVKETHLYVRIARSALSTPKGPTQPQASCRR